MAVYLCVYIVGRKGESRGERKGREGGRERGRKYKDVRERENLFWKEI